jgi:mannose-6-phosphate isomerase-like protein (cupin superfamily)
MPTLALEDYPHTDHAAHDATRHYRHQGTSINIKATARETNHAHSLIELTVPGRFPGAPLHYHQTFVESFYVLEGQIQAIRGDETLTATPGTLLHMPIGMVHGFHNATDQPARFLVICTPGGFDSFFTDLIAWMQREPQWPPADRNALIAFGLKHDTYYI